MVLLDGSLAGPNGIALSPDESVLYVGNWDPGHKAVLRYDVSADGSVGPGSVLVDLTDADGDDAIDGIKVDERGNLWVCGPGGIWIVSPSGERLGRLRLPEDPHNLTWGDEDGRGLYVTALTSVYRMRLPVAGIRPQ